MEKSVTIQSVRDATCLTFSEAAAESFTAALASSHFSGRVVVSTYHSRFPSPLFDEMAREWRGWDGKKQWTSLEDELALAATADSLGHIELVVTMRDYGNANWHVQASLHLEAGQLDALAQALRDMFESANS